MLDVVGMDPGKNENEHPSPDDPNPRVTFRIRRADWEQLDRVAEVKRSTVAQLVREIVGAALDAGFANG